MDRAGDDRARPLSSSRFCSSGECVGSQEPGTFDDEDFDFFLNIPAMAGSRECHIPTKRSDSEHSPCRIGRRSSFDGGTNVPNRRDSAVIPTLRAFRKSRTKGVSNTDPPFTPPRERTQSFSSDATSRTTSSRWRKITHVAALDVRRFQGCGEGGGLLHCALLFLYCGTLPVHQYDQTAAGYASQAFAHTHARTTQTSAACPPACVFTHNDGAVVVGASCRRICRRDGRVGRCVLERASNYGICVAPPTATCGW